MKPVILFSSTVNTNTSPTDLGVYLKKDKLVYSLDGTKNFKYIVHALHSKAINHILRVIFFFISTLVLTANDGQLEMICVTLKLEEFRYGLKTRLIFQDYDNMNNCIFILFIYFLYHN